MNIQKQVWSSTRLLAILLIMVGCRQSLPPIPDTPSTAIATQTAPTPDTGAILRLTALVSSIEMGDTLEVAVEADRVVNMTGAEVHLQFDVEFLQVEDADPEEEGVQAGHGLWLQPDFVAVNLCDNQIGVVDYAIAQMPPHAAVNGDGQLFTLIFKAMTSGTANIVLSEVLLADTSAQEIPVAVMVDTLTITIE